ncbi:MAG TPA: tetratricopeptide repeat protein [Thermoanaerobaculia bacterium]|nr:tetratricopeptide repeat protein [Thermoanaerobaculia bacterium]
MVEGHVSEELLGRFIRVEVSRREAQNVVRHLLSGCARCLEAVHRVATEAGLFGSASAAGWEQAYEKVFEHALAFANEEEQRLALEKLRGWALWGDLRPLTPQRRLSTVEADERFHTFGLYDRLLEAGRWALRSEPAEAVHIARLAIRVAERLDPARNGEHRRADLRSAAWGALGNALRVAEDFEGARRAFNEAWKILEEEGSNDPLERAALLSLEASYIKEIGEFETAESALEEALEIYRKVGDAHLQGRVLLKMGEAIGHVAPERGIAHLRKASALLDKSREPRLELSVQHALAWFLNDLGRPEEALVAVDRARPVYRQFPDASTQLRLHLLEGRIAHCLGELSEAESIFGRLREDFRVLGLNQGVVLVTIELAQVLIRQGEPARAAQLAAESYTAMRSWGLHNDALAAWLVFQDALFYGKSLGDLFERLGEYYRRHWFTPARFDPDRS